MAEAYLRRGNAAGAYREVTGSTGSNDTCSAEGKKRLRSVQGQQALAELRTRAADRAATSVQEWVANELKLARFDVARVFDENGHLLALHDIDPDTRAAIQSIEIEEERVEKAVEGGVEVVVRTRVKKVRTHSKDGAQERLARHLGAYEKDNEQTHPIMRLVEKLPSENLALLEELLRGCIGRSGDGGAAVSGRPALIARSGK